MSDRRQMQGQPLQPCIAPRALRGHPSSRVEILQCALHDACADKNFFTKTPPHRHKNTTTGSQKHHHITPPQKYHHSTTKTQPHHHKKTPPHQHKNTTQKHKHHHTITKTQPYHHSRNTTTKAPPPPPQKHHHITTTKTQPHHHHKKTPQKHHKKEGWSTGPRSVSAIMSGRASKRRPPVRSRPCLETMLQLVGQQLQASICCAFKTASKQVSFSFTSRSAGQQAGMSRVTNIGRIQTIGLEDRLSCMWNDVWNDVRTPASTLSTVQSAGQHMERHHMQVSFSFTSRSAGQQTGLSRVTTTMGGPKLCLVLRIGWAACGTTSGTTSKRRPGAGTLAHGNRQRHNTEEGSVLAKKQKHACWF